MSSSSSRQQKSSKKAAKKKVTSSSFNMHEAGDKSVSILNWMKGNGAKLQNAKKEASNPNGIIKRKNSSRKEKEDGSESGEQIVSLASALRRNHVDIQTKEDGSASSKRNNRGCNSTTQPTTDNDGAVDLCSSTSGGNGKITLDFGDLKNGASKSANSSSVKKRKRRNSLNDSGTAALDFPAKKKKKRRDKTLDEATQQEFSSKLLQSTAPHVPSSASSTAADVIDLTADDTDVTPTILSDLYFINPAPSLHAHRNAEDKKSHLKHYGGDVQKLGLEHQKENFVYLFSLLDGKFLLNRLLLKRTSISLFIEEIPRQGPNSNGESANKYSSKKSKAASTFRIKIHHDTIKYLKYNQFIGAFVLQVECPFSVHRVKDWEVQQQSSETETTTTTVVSGASGGRILGSAQPKDSFEDLQEFDSTQQILICIKDLDEIEWSTILSQWVSLLDSIQVDQCTKAEIYYLEDKCKRLCEQRKQEKDSEAMCPIKKGHYILRNRFYAQQKEQEENHLHESFWENMYQHESVQRSRDEIHILIDKPNEVAFTYNGIDITNSDIYRMSPGQFLNDNVLDFFLKFFADHYQKTTRAHIFNTQFYQLLLRDTEKCVLSIPRFREGNAIKIFENDFVLIPTNEGAHWSLFIVCFPSAISKHHPRYHDRCILSCDSMGEINHGVKLGVIHQYLSQRYTLETGSTNFPKIPVRYAQMPQQDNHFDCGFFLLSFVEFFLQHRLRNYNRVNVLSDTRLIVNQHKQSLSLREYYRERLLLVGTGTSANDGANGSHSMDPLDYNADWLRSQTEGV